MANRMVDLTTAGGILEVDPGDRIVIGWQTTYIGPAFRETVQVDIYEGIWGVNDDAKTYGKVGVDFPESLEAIAYRGDPITTGPIPANCVGLTLGLYIKIGNVMPVKGVGAFDNVIQVSGAKEPEFSDLMITSYSKV